jgi:16S rRNA pseudouridine516 synthase
MHPRHHVPKTYEVWVKDVPSDRIINQWQDGIILDGKLTLPAIVNILQIERNKYQTPRTQVQIVLSEGRNRQIRRMAEQFGHPVLALHRVAIATIALETLKIGAYRHLIAHEIRTLGVI